MYYFLIMLKTQCIAYFISYETHIFINSKQFSLMLHLSISILKKAFSNKCLQLYVIHYNFITLPHYHFFILEKSFLPRTLEVLLLDNLSSVSKHFSCRALYNNSASFVFPSIPFSSSCVNLMR